MPMTLEYGGVEKTFGAWGFDEDTAKGEFSSMTMDLFTIFAPGAVITEDAIIPFEGVAIIRRSAGGTIEFKGKRLLQILEGTPEREGVYYQFAGPWYDFEQTPFRQGFKVYTGDPDALGTEYITDVILFQKFGVVPLAIVKLNTGEQITAIAQQLLDDYAAQGLAAPFQLGVIEPAVNVPTYQVKDVMCAEAVRVALRSSPDATVYFDYTFNPPKLHVKLRGSLAAVSLAIAAANHKGVHLTPRPDLQASSVVLHFKQTNEVDGQSWITTTKQKYGPHGANSALDPDGGLRVVVQTIDLQGYSRSDVFGDLKCSTCNAQVGSQSARRTWWAKYVPEVGSTKMRFPITLRESGEAGGIAAATVKDVDTGAAVSLATYPNVLDDGQIADWMKLAGGTAVIFKRVTIEANFFADMYDAAAAVDDESVNGNWLDQLQAKKFSAHLTVTNAITGAYSAIASEIEGEAIPANLARDLYNALAVLQYEGRDLRIEDETTGLVSMANVLNLTGGRAEWATMKAQVQQVRRYYGRGISEATVGPVAHLSAGDLTEIFLFNRFRRVWSDPNTQASAKSGSSANAVTLGKALVKENTNQGLETKALAAVRSPSAETDGYVQVVKNAPSGKLVIETVDLGTPPARVPTLASIELALADCTGSDGNPHAIKIREVQVCVDGSNMRMLVAASAPY